MSFSTNNYKPTLGRHTLLDLYDCEALILNNQEEVQKIMLEAARRGGATIVEKLFHTFSPQGISGVVVIAESHLAIHTWPEHGYAAIDLFTCSATISIDEITNYLASAFRSKRVKRTEFARGTELGMDGLRSSVALS